MRSGPSPGARAEIGAKGAYRCVDKAVPAGAHHLTVYAGIDNLFDEKYSGNIRINSDGGRYFEPAPGGSIYTGLKFRL
ncbi:hypothetical protein [Salinisphaera sp. LB1]|uniref:hypothetical protein n=1 Tax=Salinisphaera sp. LB1 TaxID=2183911 RepID=UPI0013140D29|nr:hypothetical protein [Salinisphaera sp. LB1]